MDNGNGRNKLLYWVIGVQATLILTMGGFLLDALRDHGTQIHRLDVTMATISEQVDQLRPLIEMTRLEQVDRTKLFADIREKILLLDQRVTAFSLRLDMHSQRILSLSTRLEKNAVIHGDEGLGPPR